MKIRFISWTWTEQINTEKLNAALVDVFDEKHSPSITEIDNKGRGYEIVVSSEALAKDQAQAVWEVARKLDAVESPYDAAVEIDLEETMMTATALRAEKKLQPVGANQ